VGDTTQINTIAEIAQKVSAENDRRKRQSETIKALLTERQEVIVAMCDLAELESKDSSAKTVLENLKSFNQTLKSTRTNNMASASNPIRYLVTRSNTSRFFTVIK